MLETHLYQYVVGKIYIQDYKMMRVLQKLQVVNLGADFHQALIDFRN